MTLTLLQYNNYEYIKGKRKNIAYKRSKYLAHIFFKGQFYSIVETQTAVPSSPSFSIFSE